MEISKVIPFFVNRWAYSVVSMIVFFIMVRFTSLEGWGWLSLGLIIYIFFEQVIVDVIEPSVFKFNTSAHGLCDMFSKFERVAVFFSFLASLILYFLYDNLNVLYIGLAFTIIVPVQLRSAIYRNMALKRKFFKQVNCSILFSIIVASVLSLTSMYLGADYFSFLINYASFNIISYFVVKLWFVDSNDASGLEQGINDISLAKDFDAFVRSNSLSTFLNIFSNRLDILFIGAVSGEAAAGVANLCKRLVQVIQELLGSSIDKFAMSLKSDKAKPGFTGFRIANMQMKLLMPVFCMLSFYSQDIISTLFGMRWSEVASYLPIFCVGGFFRAISNIEKNNLVMAGKSSKVVLCRVVDLVVTLFGLALVFMHGNDYLYLISVLFCVKYVLIYNLFILFYSENAFGDIVKRKLSMFFSLGACYAVYVLLSQWVRNDGSLFLLFTVSMSFFLASLIMMIVLFKFETYLYARK